MQLGKSSSLLSESIAPLFEQGLRAELWVSEQASGVGYGQGSLECFSPWGCMHGHDLVTQQPQTHPNIELREKISIWNKVIPLLLSWASVSIALVMTIAK